MVNLILFKDPLGLNEIFQNIDIKFSFIHQKKDGSYKQISTPGKCRDFLGDALWSKRMGKPVSIYGFKYSWKASPFDEDALKLSLKFPNMGALEAFKSHVEFIHEKEKVAGVELTQVLDTDDKEHLIVIADKAWQKSPWRLSLYTYYIKVASYINMKELKYPEDSYAETLNGKEEPFLKNVLSDEDFFHDELYHNHDRAGFIATIQGMNGITSITMFPKEKNNALPML